MFWGWIRSNRWRRDVESAQSTTEDTDEVGREFSILKNLAEHIFSGAIFFFFSRLFVCPY